MIQQTLLPLVVALITGGFSSYVGVVAAMGVIETKIYYIEANVDDMTSVIKQININQTELVRRGMWIESVEKRLNTLESKSR